MMRADWGLVSDDVDTMKVALDEPAGTVTLDGTVAATGLSLVNGTTTPPAAAAEVRRTVPVTGFPPTTSVTGSVTEDRAGATAALATAEPRGEDTVSPEAAAAD
jgi:hypothetical protein